MKCPACATIFAEPVERCPECKLSLQRLDMKFGMVPRHSRYLTDRTGRILLNEMAQLRAALRLFEKKFPQILFSVFVDDLPPGSSAGEFAFWMANRARFSSVEKKGGENFDLLLVIDLGTNSAALTSGYGLERYAREQDLQEVLQTLAGPLRAGNVADGIREVIDALTRRLRELYRRARETKPQKEAELLADAG